MKVFLLSISFWSLVAGGYGSEFRSLFNGQNFDGWKNSGNWVIADDGSIFREKKGGGLVYTAEKVPDDFELRFEWKVGEKSNSGIYYRPSQYEYQILDNGTHNDGKNPRTSAASLYFCIQPSEDATKPVGEWNTGKVICKGTIVQHWLNGKKVIHFDYADPDAPKGGSVRQGTRVSFDTTNGLRFPGKMPNELNYIYDTLMVRAEDEPASFYGLLAERVDVASDYAHITFHINDLARWHDGTPLTAFDVKFTFETLSKHGLPGYRTILDNVR
ncbi:MAG: family 16 glycoside hydrolase, partial [Verrucomicrobiota bacterium]